MIEIRITTNVAQNGLLFVRLNVKIILQFTQIIETAHSDFHRLLKMFLNLFINSLPNPIVNLYFFFHS